MFKNCCVCISKKVDSDNLSQKRSPKDLRNPKTIPNGESPCARVSPSAGRTTGFAVNNFSNGSTEPSATAPAPTDVPEEVCRLHAVTSGESDAASYKSDMESSIAEVSPIDTSKSDEKSDDTACTVKDVSVKFNCDEINDADKSDSDSDSDYVIDKLTSNMNSGGLSSGDNAGDENEADDKSDEENEDNLSDYVCEKVVVPPERRKSSTGGILKRPSLALGELPLRITGLRLDVDDDVFKAPDCLPDSQRIYIRKRSLPAGALGTAVGKDELALKRHRIFSELVGAARAAVEHKVRFDPLELVASAPEKEHFKSAAPNLEKLIERLEGVVLRLEQVATFLPNPPASVPISPQESSSTESPVISPKRQASPPSTMSLQVYKDIMEGPLERFVQCSAKMQHVEEQAALVKKLFETQWDYLNMVSKSSPPSNQNDTISQLKGHTEGIEGVQKLRESNKTSPNFTHLSAISESIPALGWICVKPAPAPYIKEMNEVGKYYTNRILKESKGNQQQTNWCIAWTETLGSLEAFVKQYHTTGLTWGGSAGAGPCPPPPPCPPPCMPPPPDAMDDGSNDDRTALFAQINQGADITKTLKKVTSEMQTHKNPTLREGPAPFKAPVGAPKPFAKSLPTPGAGQAPAKPPVFSRDGKKWLVEYQVNNPNLVVENTEMNNVVYMFRCRESSITVKGKINSVVLDSCSKCAVIFDTLVSSVEFVNCQSVQMQVLGKVPTISIDKTDGCQMYLSPDSMDVEIITSKSSEMNVMIPKGNGDFLEQPIAEQFKTTINQGTKSLSTVAIENKG